MPKAYEIDVNDSVAQYLFRLEEASDLGFRGFRRPSTSSG